MAAAVTDRLGRAPVVDFDGTLTHLPVDWAALRGTLRVERLIEVWDRERPSWELVTETEMSAAATAEPVRAATRALEHVDAFAILSANSERAIRTFLSRFPELERKVRLIVGRETLGGPKSELVYFRDGLTRCVCATAPARAEGPVIYLGDQPYELEFARDSGATAVDVQDLEP